MNSNFEKCLEMLLVHEGGFVNHPDDPGGMTNLGVTKKVWEEWVGHDVSEKEMRNLTPTMVAPLYQRKYWNACRADDLISGLDYCVFDVAVNSGVGRAISQINALYNAFSKDRINAKYDYYISVSAFKYCSSRLFKL